MTNARCLTEGEDVVVPSHVLERLRISAAADGSHFTLESQTAPQDSEG